MRILSEYRLADVTIRYVTDDASERVGLMMAPTETVGQLVPRRATLAGRPEIDMLPGGPVGAPVASVIDPLAHVKIVGDPYPGAFAQGRTMRSSPSNDRFRFDTQREERDGDRTAVVTRLTADDGCRIEHRLAWNDGDEAGVVTTTFVNGSDWPVTLEMLTAFSLGGLTPFAVDDAPGRLRVHRFRSVWSAEGRAETLSIEQLHLERSWSGAGLFSERFGQLGTMPVRGWFPFVAIEDVAAGVTWGAQLAWAGSWQIEVARQHDDVCLSGGLADREFGHWTKTLAAGESITSPPAIVSCALGGIDELCDRLTAMQNRAADAQPAVERDLPVVFNEFCTTWGDPRHDRVVAIADRLRGTGVRYLVIDAGWYKPDVEGNWDGTHGDWVPNREMFPQGLTATANAIRERGLIPGLWFEMESVGERSVAFSLVDHLLKRDGLPITVRGRRFWHLDDPAALDYLTDRVIGTLRDAGFGYLKVDYNETLGLGCDGRESQGEGLRRQVLGVYRLFDRIRSALPDLVIENCSSGGHRLEPSMLACTAMSSYSDAHELVEIPIIAANLQRLILPRQSQIWAVLHAADDDRRLTYSLASTFLGRMCLSGEIDRLSPHQLSLVAKAQQLYHAGAPIVRDGVSRRFGQIGQSWRSPRGWQGVVRTARDGNSALVVLHAFAGAPGDVELPLPSSSRAWKVVDTLTVSGLPSVAVSAPDRLTWQGAGDFAGTVAILRR